MILLKIGSRGMEVEKVQEKLNIHEDGFGPLTDTAVREYQKEHGLNVDGEVGNKTWASLMGISSDPYRDVVFEGSTFPGSPYRYDVNIRFGREMTEEYLPALEKAIPDEPAGLKLLVTVMAYKEGFYHGTRSYANNNPGNIGDTDSGHNMRMSTLEEGITLQRDYVVKVAEGKHPAYPMNKPVHIKPYYSPEIDRNRKVYGLSPYLPGYNFTFTGQLDQYVKIYSTGARESNSYINIILSYFKRNGLDIRPDSKIQDIIRM